MTQEVAGDGSTEPHVPAVRPEAFVQSLERGLAVIRAFSREQPRLSLSDVARTTGMTRAAARRYLITLQHLGYTGSDGRQFYLRSPVLQLGYSYLASLSLAEMAQEHLVHLAEQLHESCSASVLDGAEIVYVARAATTRVMSISLTVGARLPAYCTSMGRILLAHLPDDELDGYLDTLECERLTPNTVVDKSELRAELTKVRRQGFSLVDQELEYGVRSVAVPLFEASGVVGAMNISAHATRVPMRTLRQDFLPEALKCAERINSALRARTP